MRRTSAPNPPRSLSRLLCALLLVVTGGASAAGTAAAAPGSGTAAAPVGLDRVVPAPASVRPGGKPYEIGPRTRIRVPDTREGRRTRAAGPLPPSPR